MVPKDGIHPVEVVDEGEAGGDGHQPLDRRSISSSSSSSSSARLQEHSTLWKAVLMSRFECLFLPTLLLGVGAPAAGVAAAQGDHQ